MSMCLDAISELQQWLRKRLNGMACQPAQVQQQRIDGLLDLITVLHRAALNRGEQGRQAHQPQGQDQHALAALRHTRRNGSNWDSAMRRDVAEHRPRHERVVHRLDLTLQNGQHQGSPLQRGHAVQHFAVPLVQVRGPLAVCHVTVFARLAVLAGARGEIQARPTAKLRMSDTATAAAWRLKHWRSQSILGVCPRETQARRVDPRGALPSIGLDLHDHVSDRSVYGVLDD
mmetsp:Transcript_7822/g.21780  ORF Transcript_7822/g.21780 Transcript_7822/m.21780 type:complete len:230 (+) Transcript_7822:224-913(+)